MKNAGKLAISVAKRERERINNCNNISHTRDNANSPLSLRRFQDGRSLFPKGQVLTFAELVRLCRGHGLN